MISRWHSVAEDHRQTSVGAYGPRREAGTTPRMTHRRSTHTTSRSRGMSCPSCAAFAHPHQYGGRRECRVKASPMARLQKKKQAAVTTGAAGSSGIPCAAVLTLIRALLGDRLVVPICGNAPSARCRRPQHREARTTRFHVRDAIVRPHARACCEAPRPPHPRLACRDDRAQRPSVVRRDGRDDRRDLPDKARCTTATDWHDGQFAHGGYAHLAASGAASNEATKASFRTQPTADASSPKWPQRFG